MTILPRLAAIACAALLLVAAPQVLQAAEFSGAQKSAIEKIVHDYLVTHPEVLQEAIGELEKRQQAADAAKHQQAVKAHAKALFDSPDQVVLGNPKGDVTLVEFFDYNCPYCKHAMSDMLTLLKADPNLKIVLKEFPVLGPASVQAARVAVAVRMQDPSKYLEFHKKLLGSRNHADEARALAVAKEIGMDMTRIKKDMKGAEVQKTLTQDYGLAEALGLTGTPSYVVGNKVIVGAVGLPALKADINTARCGKATC
ncbi:MAG TPA: DsbA family protein [Pseudolabrys sp.]|jgi:protein-disulfide isomerase|nr:DsbA family protein [Pseudolabrys sp.]